MQDVRRIALELRPKVLDDYGLVSALERLATHLLDRRPASPSTSRPSSAPSGLPTELETALYRIVQEGLTNVAKHADPSRASVLLTPKNGSVLLVLEDDGRGFDPAKAAERRARARGDARAGRAARGPPHDRVERGRRHDARRRGARPVIRVLIVDDHAVVRDGLRLVLEKHDDIEAVGEAGSVDEAVEQARGLQPDLVLLDLAMPGKPGLQAMPGLLRGEPGGEGADPLDGGRPALRPGGVRRRRARLPAQGGRRERGRRRDPRGRRRRPLRPPRARRAADRERAAAGAAPREDPLSDREREVLTLLALGHTNHEIAKQLFISVRTAEAHRAHIMKKLGLESRAELVRYAIANGLRQI